MNARAQEYLIYTHLTSTAGVKLRTENETQRGDGGWQHRNRSLTVGDGASGSTSNNIALLKEQKEE